MPTTARSCLVTGFALRKTKFHVDLSFVRGLAQSFGSSSFHQYESFMKIAGLQGLELFKILVFYVFLEMVSSIFESNWIASTKFAPVIL